LRLGKQITIGLVALPVAELIVFLAVALAIGVTAALALMIGTSLAGALVLRHVGRARIGQIRATLDNPAAAADRGGASGLLLVLAGILLILPGFITDLAGLALLIPPLRRWCGAMLGRFVVAPGAAQRRDAVVDLAPDEWRQVGNPELPGAGDKADRR
jgi:UPF0716 protein FxsA